MGVMSCSRNECDNIMCDTYINNVGYVCFECKNEFEEYLKNNNISKITERSMRKHLEQFMETRKDEYIEGEIVDMDTFFEKNSL